MTSAFDEYNRNGLAVGSVLVLALILAFVPTSVYAEDIYKIVDEEANVTYSSEPPRSGQATEVIQILPPPSQEDVEAARQRQRKIEAEFDKLDQARAEQLRLDGEHRVSNTMTVVQTNTVIGTPGIHGRHLGGARTARGARTSHGFRPHHNRMRHRSRSAPFGVHTGIRAGP